MQTGYIVLHKQFTSNASSTTPNPVAIVEAFCCFTFHPFDGCIHSQSILFDAGLQDLSKVPLSDDVLELDVVPLQGWVGYVLRGVHGLLRHVQGAGAELYNGFLSLQREGSESGRGG